MAAVANSPEFSKKAGVPMSVGSEFMDADQGKKFRTGRVSPKAGINKQKTHHGSMQMPNAMLNKYMGRKNGGIMKHSDMKEDMKMDKSQDKSMIKKAFKQHDMQEHKGGKGTTLKLASGGKAAQLNKANGIAIKGKSKGTMIKMNKGGMC